MSTLIIGSESWLPSPNQVRNGLIATALESVKFMGLIIIRTRRRNISLLFLLVKKAVNGNRILNQRSTAYSSCLGSVFQGVLLLMMKMTGRNQQLLFAPRGSLQEHQPHSLIKYYCTVQHVGVSGESWADVVRGTGNMVPRREANDKGTDVDKMTTSTSRK